MAKDKLTGRVSYRLGSQVFRQVERQAAARGISPNEWCRQAVIEKLKSQATSQGQALTKVEQILAEEILRLRWLIQNGMDHYLRKKTITAGEWEYFVGQAGGGGQIRDEIRKWMEGHGFKPTS